MKLVYFENEEYEPIKVVDLIEGASDNNRNGMSGMLGGLEQLFQGGNMENLMKMLGGADLE